jgi:hypothetical protein
MPDAPLFDQKGWKVDKVYNVAGDLILTEGGSRDDFVQALQRLRRDVEDLPELDDGDRRALAQELTSATEEAAQPDPPKDRMLTRLSRIQARLQALSGASVAAASIANSIAGVAHIAGGIF